MQRLNYFLAISSMAFVIFWLGSFIIFHQMIRSYPVDMVTKTDAVVVLTGGRNRIAEAVKLYNQGLAETLIISGVGPKVNLKQIEQKNKTSVDRLPQHVIIGNEATNTIENAIEVNEAIRRNNLRSIRLVTSNYHMPRSEAEILAQNHDLIIIRHPVYSQNVSRKWWKRWNSFYLIASEFHKFIYVYMKNFYYRIVEQKEA